MKSLVLTSALASLLLPMSVMGAGVVGNGTAASCTEAALHAAAADGGNITFNCGLAPVVIKMTKQLEFYTHATLDGGNLVTLDGQEKVRHLLIRQGGFGGEDDNIINVRNITLANGFSTGKGGSIHSSYWNTLNIENVNFYNNRSTKDDEACAGGGAIWLDAENTSFIKNSVFIGNHANNGGGVNTVFSDVTIVDSYFENNKAIHTKAINKLSNCGGGGAVRFESAKKSKYSGTRQLKVLRSVFINNETNHAGGALETYIYGNEDVTVKDSLFYNNRSFKYGEGGAIAHAGPSDVTGRIHVLDSAIISNLTQVQGGGLYFQAPGIVKNSSLVGNKAINLEADEEWQKGFGGGVALNGKQRSTFTNVTFAYNYAGALGGAIEGGESSVFKNTIVAHNHGDNKWGIQLSCIASVVNGGNNLQIPIKSTKLSNDYDCFKGMAAKDPMIANWANNENTPDGVVPWNTIQAAWQQQGGLTPVIPIIDGNSPAIAAGKNCTETDQRGVARKGSCEIGAYEYVNRPANFSINSNASGSLANLSLSLSLNVDARDLQQPGYFYLAAGSPSQGAWFFFGPNGNPVPLGNNIGSSVWPPVASATLNNIPMSQILRNANLSALPADTILYLGYGRTQFDMAMNGKLRRIYPQ